MNNENENLANLYFKLYTGCIEYKKNKKDKVIDCEKYYNSYNILSKLNENKDNNKNL
jgi:hypothetical protein